MARAVAALVYERFTGTGIPERLVPDARTIEEVINAAFWASMRREEGRSPKISVAYVSRDLCETALSFARPIALGAPMLTRLAPAVEHPGIHLVVARERGELQIWGTTRRIPAGTFVLEVIRPGLLVVKQRRTEAAGKFANLVVLEGDEIRIVHEERTQPAGLHAFIRHLLSIEAPRTWADPANVTVQLATAMRAHAHGGTLLVVPPDSAEWRDSIADPLVYEVVPPYREIALLLAQQRDPAEELLWRERLRRAVDVVAGLTAVDGATVIDTRYELMAFGAKIHRRRNHLPVQQVLLTPIVDTALSTITNAAELGGTRHLSAAQFAHDQRDALALVASQDGNFTAFTWSEAEQMVAAYRVEALLL